MKMADVVSVYLLAAGMGWLCAQIIKYVVQVIKIRNWRALSSFYKSGNMPSVHTATTTALATAIGLRLGTGSVSFAIMLVLALIVAYDAMQVRRSVGEQGTALSKLIKAHTKSARLPHHSSGHAPFEVLAGAIIGIASGALVVVFATYFSF